MSDDQGASDLDSSDATRQQRTLAKMNPYQTPQADTGSDGNMPAPYGPQTSADGSLLRAALPIGLLGGLASGFAYLMAFQSSMIGAWIVLLAVLWIGSFALLGAFTKGTLTDKAWKGLGFGLLSLPIYGLFVPVCTVGTIVSGAAIDSSGLASGEAGLVVGSTVAFSILLIGFAMVARNTIPPSIPKETDEH